MTLYLNLSLSLSLSLVDSQLALRPPKPVSYHFITQIFSCNSFPKEGWNNLFTFPRTAYAAEPYILTTFGGRETGT